jgi:small-conductance mechanosensitive channel
LLLDPLLTMGRAVLGWIPDLAFLVLLVLVTRLFLRLVHLFFLEIERGALKFETFDAEWAMPTYRLARIFVIAFAVVVAFPYIPGSSTGAFKGVSLFVGVLFSLGSSSIIGNVIAGYTMTYRRAFRNGDVIRVGDVVGHVTHTRLLVTNVRTTKNVEVVIPNSLILSSHVVNYSSFARSAGLILHTTVGIGYEIPWRQVEAMLQMAAGRTEGLRREPAPFVLQTALGDFAVTYELNVYCDSPREMPRLYTALHRNILDVFNEHGVQIMTPAYEGDPAEPKIVPRERWHTPPAEPPA